MTTRRYASDITREQFELVRPILETARKRTKPRVIDLYEVFCAVLYLLKTGCQWRLIPSDYPKWRTVHKQFQNQNHKAEHEGPSCLEQALKKLVGEERTKQRRKEGTSFCIIDAQSVKNTDTAEAKGYDAGKKISAIKWHIAVDT